MDTSRQTQETSDTSSRGVLAYVGVWFATLLGERLNWPTFAGAAAIGASIVVVSLLKK